MEVVHRNDIEKIEGKQVIFKSDKKFSQVELDEPAVYSSSSKNSDAGVMLTETVTAKTKNNSKVSFLKNALKYYIIRLYTNTDNFLVGTLDYPAEKTYTSDHNTINFTYKASKPLL